MPAISNMPATSNHTHTLVSKRVVRCAAYTRKSTEEGLEQEFNSLDAQREAAEAYIKSQSQEGWQCLPVRYDDGGFTGANMDRPALQRLLSDIEAGQIDCVVVYKVDRLSRSLLDFARMMETFDKHRVAFVSITQQFNSASSMGRLVLNVLLSFAQFEREIISERTRDKIAAARRKGKWSGGLPILGYDVDERSKLIVNQDEAKRVQEIFALYLKHQGLLPVVWELERRGWTNKRWITRKGQEQGGKPFTKTALHKLLTNVVYVGKVRYKNEVHQGEHVGIVEPETWQCVQDMLRENRWSSALGGPKQGCAPLKGLVRCVPCGCAMTPAHSLGNGSQRYRYYTCTGAQKRGWHTCPSKSVPAAQMEKLVVQQIQLLSQDPAFVMRAVAEAEARAEAERTELDKERQALEQGLAGWTKDSRTLATGKGAKDQSVLARLADLQEVIQNGKRRLAELREQRAALQRQRLTERQVTTALVSLEPFWDSLSAVEQTRLVRLVVERIDYDGTRGRLAITFHARGLITLAQEIISQHKETQV